MKRLYYEKSGDNYKLKDPFKILALKAAKKTAKNINRFKDKGIDIEEIEQSRGESAYRIKITTDRQVNFQLAHVEEGIGTKNVVADELACELGDKIYETVAIDNAASIFNDLSTTGASPLSFLLHLAAYPTEWFSRKTRIKAILKGTVKACNLAGASWGGGESPTMRDIIRPGRALLSGSATGIIFPSEKALSEEKLKEGDRIILLESSGVHTNGITLLRKELLGRLPRGYKTKLSDGKSYGETILTPTVIYSKVVEEMVENTEIHYAVHITGHGWRKILRADREFSYVIEKIPTPQPIFETIKKYSKSSDEEMYNSYNMGAGFALFAPKTSIKKIFEVCQSNRIGVIDAGYVEKGKKKLTIRPLGIEFGSKDLEIR